MTRNKDSAQRFWREVDVRLKQTGLNLYDLADASCVPYRSILSWRQKHLFPDLETTMFMAQKMNCSIDRLMGNDSVKDIDPRIDAIIRYLQKDEKKIEAIEVILFGEKAGVLSSHGTDIA